jgi:two-component system response regulator
MPKAAVPAPHLLVAEDDDDEFLLTKEALAGCSFPGVVHRVKNGEELLEFLVRRQGEQSASARPPLLILLDLNMPRMDGRAALKEIKSSAALHAIPVVVLTNSTAPMDIEKCYDLGANTYICKPSRFSDFVDVLKTLTRYWTQGAQLPR